MVVRGSAPLPPTATLRTQCSACGEVLPPNVGHVPGQWVDAPEVPTRTGWDSEGGEPR
jgi:hypothetical protein